MSYISCHEFELKISSFQFKIISDSKVKLARLLRTVLRPLQTVESKFLTFFRMIIDIKLWLENILQWFGFDPGENLGRVRKSRFWTNFKMAEKLSGAEMKSEIAILFWLSQGLQGYKTLESTTSSLGVMTHFASLVAIAPPMGWFGWDFDTFSSNWGLPAGWVSSF